MRKVLFVMLALIMSTVIKAQEIEKIDKFASGYINGTYMNKYKTIDGVLYAVGYEGTKDWILVRYPAGSRNTTYNLHPNCRRIARGAFEGAAYLREIYLPETVSLIGEDAFAGCTSLQGIYYGESTPSAVRGIEANTGTGVIIRGQPIHRLTKYLSTTEHEECQVTDSMHLCSQSLYL